MNFTQWYKQDVDDTDDMEFIRNNFDNTLKITGSFEAELKFVGDYDSSAHTMIKNMVNDGDIDTGRDNYIKDISIESFSDAARLEQRLGRIKRFGQSRKCVDMLNLVCNETLDKKFTMSYQKDSKIPMIFLEICQTLLMMSGLMMWIRSMRG